MLFHYKSVFFIPTTPIQSSLLLLATILFSACGTGGGDSSNKTGKLTPESISISSVSGTTVHHSLSIQLTAIGSYANNTQQKITTNISWTSNNTDIATVDGNGTVTGNKTGMTKIKANFPNLASAETTITVTPILKSGTLQGTTLSLANDVTTLTGLVGKLGSQDGLPSVATFGYSLGMTTDGDNLYVSDSTLIRKISMLTGEVKTLNTIDGSGTKFNLVGIDGMTTDGIYLYITDNRAVRKIKLDNGMVTTIAGSDQNGFADGKGANAVFKSPRDITSDGTYLYVTDMSNYRIRRIDIASGDVITFAGSSIQGVKDGNGIAAGFQYPSGITSDGTFLYVADDNVIRKININTREVITIAGSLTNSKGFADLTGNDALFWVPEYLTTDGYNLYISDTGNQRVRKLDLANNKVTTLAGSATGQTGSNNGNGSSATFFNPRGISSDSKNLYVVDSINSTVRKIQ